MRFNLQTTLLFTGVAVLSLLMGIYFARWLAKEEPVALPEPSQINVPKFRPDFSMLDLAGETRHIREWDGKVVVLNFWATWCPPCLKEMPTFVALREELASHPFEVIGVAIDPPQPVRDFVDQLGVEYPILLGEMTGIRAMQDYGNQLATLPYTVVIDRQQRIAKVFRKEITREEILDVVGPLLNLEAASPSPVAAPNQ